MCLYRFIYARRLSLYCYFSFPFLDNVSLIQDYKNVLLDGRNHDLILKIGDKELRAHQDILRARSRVFQSMLDHDMKEKSSGIIDVPDCDPRAMELYLSYVYCVTVEAHDQSNMLGLYYIADKYDMKGLKEDCSKFIKKSLSTTNICDIIQLALRHSDSGLLEYATEYFMENALDIMVTVEWQSFLMNNSTLGNELLIKSFRKVKNVNT